ncbi:HET-domain-containing protein [Lepidopterella palustris CBS 459.81]|uniref:HET-domain-containing protein n=1 Tax=Lepidopterella palustris CBS 459.81 TaxID=1314670 RepID=A0A8E2E3E4_9PEZI|nr:HET-domain-containing protein [Lepidopterella palustris CBS 459.81]
MTVGDIGSLRSRPDCPLCRLKLTACVGGAREYSDCGRVGLNSRSNSFQVGPLGTRIVFVKNPEAPAWLPQLGLMITSSQIPFGLVQQWLSLCQETHGPDCVPLPLEYGQNGLQRFRVIDVVSDCIVDAPLNCRYTTLSYVWGNVSQFQLSTDNQQMLMSPGSLRLIYPYLPRTIQDAMLFVSSIGERYIWVDSLCLVQDNREDVDQGVRVMDLIYGGSVLTILAGSGTNANAGLPGVRPRSRHVNQAVETIAPGVKMMVLRHYDHHLRAACYSNRGWT